MARPKTKFGRRLRWFRNAQLIFVTAIGAALGAYWIIRQKRNFISRWTPVDMPFPPELLDILAAPGSDTALQHAQQRLAVVGEKQMYPVVDGIPDFGGPSRATHALAPTMWYDTAQLIEKLGWEPWRWGEEDVPRNWLAARAAWHASNNQWCLVTPGDPVEVVRLARNVPDTRLLMVDTRWSRLLEARRLASKYGVENLYYVRGQHEALPIRTDVVAGVWSSNGLEFAPNSKIMLDELIRVAAPGAVVAGATLVTDPKTWQDWWLQQSGRFPGAFTADDLRTQLTEAGLSQIEFFKSNLTLGFVSGR